MLLHYHGRVLVGPRGRRDRRLPRPRTQRGALPRARSVRGRHARRARLAAAQGGAQLPRQQRGDEQEGSPWGASVCVRS
jgi:hypothetical protein